MRRPTHIWQLVTLQCGRGVEAAEDTFEATSETQPYIIPLQCGRGVEAAEDSRFASLCPGCQMPRFGERYADPQATDLAASPASDQRFQIAHCGATRAPPELARTPASGASRCYTHITPSYHNRQEG